MTPFRLSPAHAGFTHNGEVWDISVVAWCGVWRVIVECGSSVQSLDGLYKLPNTPM